MLKVATNGFTCWTTSENEWTGHPDVSDFLLGGEVYVIIGTTPQTFENEMLNPETIILTSRGIRFSRAKVG